MPVMRRFVYACLLLAFLADPSLNAQEGSIPIAVIQSLIRSENYGKALQQTRSALHRNPTDYRLWTLQAIVLSKSDQRLEAALAFDKALRLAPTYTPALQGKVELLYATQDPGAIPLLQRLLKINPADETAHEMYAVLEAKQGHCPAAAAHFRIVEKTIANHPTSLQAYGDCLARSREYEKAIPLFRKLVTLLPKETYPKYDLAVLLIETKQYNEALKVLEPLLAADPDPDTLSLASEAYESSGDTPKAVALLRQAIVLSPSTAHYYNAFSLLCLDHESFQVGIDMIDVGLQHISGDASLYLSRGLLYAQLAQYDKAEADFRTAQGLDSKQVLSSYAMDLAELEKHEPQKALSEVRSQAKAHPESARHQYLLARLLQMNSSYHDKRSLQEAIDSALSAVKLKPDFVEARNLLASLYQESGRYALATEQCQLALRYDPSDQSAIYHLIMLLRRSDKSEDRAKIPELVKRLSALQQEARQQETDRKRFRLVEEQSAHAAATQ
jgi:tetratricopeptide (TPR) repeat protein